MVFNDPMIRRIIGSLKLRRPLDHNASRLGSATNVMQNCERRPEHGRAAANCATCMTSQPICSSASIVCVAIIDYHQW